jgi:hypothetical protein
VREKLTEIIDGCWQMTLDKEEKDGAVILERGFATIPLPGIDVPVSTKLARSFVADLLSSTVRPS